MFHFHVTYNVHVHIAVVAVLVLGLVFNYYDIPRLANWYFHAQVNMMVVYKCNYVFHKECALYVTVLCEETVVVTMR